MQAKDRGFTFSIARTRTRVTFDHTLCSEMRFDSITYGEDIAIVPEPLRSLGAKAQTFEAKANTGLTMVVLVWLFIAFFATYPARVTT